MLQAYGVIQVLGVVIVDGDAMQPATIEPCAVPRPGLISGGYQPLGLVLELSTKSVGPDAGLQRGQDVGVPLPQIHEQMANRPRFGAALGLTQGLKQRWGQGLSLVAAGPADQLGQLVGLLRIQLGGAKWLPPA